MKIFTKSNTRYKYKLLISYFLIVSIPLIIMTGVIYAVSVNKLQREIESSNQYKLTQLKNNFELRIKEMENLAARLNVDNKLTPYNMGGNEYKRIEGLQQINMYMAQNAFMDNYYLYIKNTGNVYSTDGQSTLSTLARNTYNINLQDEADFISWIRNMKFPAFIGDEWFNKVATQSGEFISYFYPISYGSYDPYGVVIFHIKKSTIADMFKNITGYNKGSLVILDRNHSILLSDDTEFKLSLDDINKIKDIKVDSLVYGGVYEKFNNKDISLIIAASENIGLTFALGIPKAQFFEQIINIKTLIIQVFLLILAFGTMLAIVFSTSIYKPINKLTEIIAPQWLDDNEQENDQRNQGKKHKRMDELDKIGQTVEIALEQNKNLKNQISIHKPFIREHILLKLLKGETLDEKTRNNLLQFSNVELKGLSFAVVIIERLLKSEDGSIRIFKDKVLKITQEKYGTKNMVYTIELVQDDAIALILNLNIKTEEYEEYTKFILEIKQILEETTKERIILGGGMLYNNINRINRSFIEALAALEENKVRGKQGILMFNEISKSEQNILWYSLEEQLRFMQSLKQGDKIVAIETLEDIFRSIERNQTSILILKYICYDIVNLIVKSINEMKINDLNYDIENLMKFTNIQELEKQTKVIVKELCDVIKERQNTKNTELNNQIIEYINDNFCDNNLSLESVADEFGFSMYYLSKFFKEHTNETFSEYIIKLRMEKAKQLLRTTNLQIKEIVCDIGYTDHTFFMRRFKKIEGITPGQYREMYKNKGI